MKYALLIHEDQTFWDREPNPEWEPVLAQYQAFGERNGAALQGGAALRTTQHAVTVRADGEERLTTDGPFAETREQFGGFFLVETDTIEDAIELAKQIPFPGKGSVEVRPVMDFGAAMA